MKILNRIWLMYFFIMAMILINLLLFGGMILELVGLISGKTYRRLADWCIGSTWCFYPNALEREAGHKVVVYNQPPPPADRVLVMANHIQSPDWSIVFWLAVAVDHLRHLKVFAKVKL